MYCSIHTGRVAICAASVCMGFKCQSVARLLMPGSTRLCVFLSSCLSMCCGFLSDTQPPWKISDIKNNVDVGGQRRRCCCYCGIVHFKRLGSRVSHDSFNQYVLFFSKQCTYCKTNAIYT